MVEKSTPPKRKKKKDIEIERERDICIEIY
jgi:hypothetical protein